MSTKTLKIGVTLNEFLNQGMKYQSNVEPFAFRTYLNLVESTVKMHDVAETKLNAQKAKLFTKGYS